MGVRMKLKLDDDGQVVVQDDKPVYQDDNGKDVVFDAPAAVAKIKSQAEDLSEKGEQISTLEKDVRSWERLGTKEEVRKAKSIVAGLTEKDLDANELPGEIERLKGEVEALTEELGTTKEKLTEKDGEVWDLQIGTRFGNSKFVRENLIDAFSENPDLLKRLFQDHFKVEDGKLVAYKDDKPILVVDPETNEAKAATFDQALDVLVGKEFRRASGARGSDANNNQGPGNPQQKRTINSKADFISTDEKLEWIDKHGREAFEQLPMRPAPAAN
jgi:hypothetical protein